MGRPEQHYRQENGHYLIELKLTEVRQMFHTLDPSPFNAKDLDEHAENYIVSSAEEFPLATPLSLRVYLPAEQLAGAAAAGLAEAVATFFAYRAEVSGRQLRRTLRDGRLSLLIGLLFLFTCIGIRILLKQSGHSDWYLQMLEEGFLISGWVAMWRPIQIHLYDWWPLKRRMRLYRKLAQMPVELHAR